MCESLCLCFLIFAPVFPSLPSGQLAEEGAVRVVESGDKVVHLLYSLSRETRETRESRNSCVGTPSFGREKIDRERG